MFGIQTGLKLFQQGQQAYVESTIDRTITLPLPNFDPSISSSVARTYFRGSGKAYLQRNPRIRTLVQKADEDHQTLSQAEENELIAAYQEYRWLDDQDKGKDSKRVRDVPSHQALLSLLAVRQYARSVKSFPSVTRRVVGTLVETGVDFFKDFRGLVDEESATGRALKGFLGSIDELDFSSGDLDGVVKGLFVAAAESIGENPDLLGGDDKTENLIKAVTNGLVEDINDRFSELSGNLSKKEKVEKWGQLVLRSVLGNVGENVLANPSSLGFDDPDIQGVVGQVGASILDVILDEDSVDLSELFGRQGLDKVVKSALSAVAEYPGILGDEDEGLRNIVSQVARSLSEHDHVLDRDMLPEVTRLVLEKTAKNAELLLPVEEVGPGWHLLVTGASTFLDRLTQVPEEGATWKPAFSKSQLTGMLESVLDELVQNPGWLLEAADDSSVLSDTLNAALDALETAPGKRVNAETAEKVLRATIKAVALRRSFLDEIPIGGEDKTALAAALEALIDSTLSDDVDAKARWTLARGEVFTEVVTTGLAKLSELGISEQTIGMVKGILDKGAGQLASGESWSLENMLGEIKALAA